MGKKTKVRVFSTSVWRALLVQTDKPTRTTVHRVMLLWLATVSRGPVRHTTHNTHTHTHAHIHTHPHTHICSNTHTHTNTNAYMQANAHTCSHTHTYTPVQCLSLLPDLCYLSANNCHCPKCPWLKEEEISINKCMKFSSISSQTN